MRVALAVNLVTADIEANIASMLKQAEAAAEAGAELVLFLEAAPTSLCNDDRPEHDLPLGSPVPGPLTDRFGAVARCWGLWIGLGFFAREGDRLYDSAVLLSPAGQVALTYRRFNPGWHAPNADRTVHREGETVPWGRAAFLVCGYLFHERLAWKSGRNPAVLGWFAPMARWLTASRKAGRAYCWSIYKGKAGGHGDRRLLYYSRLNT